MKRWAGAEKEPLDKARVPTVEANPGRQHDERTRGMKGVDTEEKSAEQSRRCWKQRKIIEYLFKTLRGNRSLI